MPIRFATVLFFLLALVGLARADDALEIIPLQHRTAAEVVPSLRPFLEPGGVLTGRLREWIALGGSDMSPSRSIAACSASARRNLGTPVRCGSRSTWSSDSPCFAGRSNCWLA